jgi:hypothetical protein
MSKQNPFRAKFSKLPVADQIKAVKKLQDRFPTLSQIVNELNRVDPVVSIRQDGRVTFLTDTYLVA